MAPLIYLKTKGRVDTAMYRFLIFLLIVLSVTVVVEIVAVIVWRDYEEHGTISLGRVFDTASPFGTKESSRPALANVPLDSTRASHPLAISGQELSAFRQEFLYLINSERVRARVTPLTLGENPAAQHHAESMMNYGYRSHWDVNGMTPEMRYTLAGGVGRVMQNVAGPIDVMNLEGDKVESLREASGRIHQDFMASPEEKSNILDPWHRQVNLGIACRSSQCWVVQQFESNHIRFSILPFISEGTLRLAGDFQEGLEFDGIALWYHPYPRPLGLGQLDATFHYGNGQRPVTFLRPPPEPGQYYPSRSVSYAWRNGIDPYTLEPALGRSAAPPLRVDIAMSAAVPWTTANLWRHSGASFEVAADLSQVVGSLGSGVYTVQVWGKKDGEQVPVANHSIFLQ